MQEADFTAIQVAGVEAVKLLSTARPEDVDRLRVILPDMFIMVRLSIPLQVRGMRAEEFSSRASEQMRPFYQKDVRYFEVHNEPNLRQEGFGHSWSNGQEFAYWFVQVRDQLKSKYPEALVGLPGLSPSGDYPEQRRSSLEFLKEADQAVRAADWLGIHCYWDSAKTMDSEAGGAVYREYQRLFPSKPLLITEFCNNNESTYKEVKGRQYAAYFEQLRQEPNILAAFSFVVSASFDFETQAWRDESGEQSAIPRVIGEWRAQEEPINVPSDTVTTVTAIQESQPAEPPVAAPPPEVDARYILSFGNDRLGGNDELNYDDYARAFASVLKNPDTKTPLTIGIYGAWGSGKSYLMQRIQLYLKAEDDKAAAAPKPAATSPLTRGQRLKRWWSGVRPAQKANAAPKIDFHIVEFNAWVYSGSENLWAGLITHLYDEVEKYLGLRRTAMFRFNRNARAAVRKNVWQLALFGPLALVLGLVLYFSDVQVGVDALGTALGGLVGIAALGAALAFVGSFISAVRNLLSSLVLQRAEQLAALASRRDFRDKIGFMADIKGEIKTIRQLLEQGRAKGAPTRLVIFIDDLDRCPPNKAVEVLEAIMLLLADEDGMPFVVVLGIDARIVVKAVEERYGKVLTEAGISGYEYLDKIVQIPFRIPAADTAALAKYVDSLLWQSEAARKAAAEEKRKLALAAEQERLRQARAAVEAEKAEVPNIAPGIRNVQVLTMRTDGTDVHEVPVEITVDGRQISSPGQTSASGSSNVASTPTPPPPQVVTPPTPEVAFTEDEREVFAALAQSSHLTSNPRRVKRIINIYRIVRMLVGKTTRQQRAQMIKWVVLSKQWPFRTAWLLQAVEDFEQNIQAKLTDASDLCAIFECVRADVQAKESQSFVVLDADPELFTSFITAAPAITVRHIRDLRRFAFNLNPALQGEVIKAAARKTGPTPPTPPVPPSERTSLTTK